MVIRAFNEESQIGRLLEGVRHQTIPDSEIILVDPGSTDATIAMAVQYGATVLHIPPAEFTFGRSLNLGLEAASCDLAVLASTHIYPVYHDWLERLLSPFEDPQVALSYGRQRGGENTQFSEQQIFSRWYSQISTIHQTHAFCNNANAALRRAIWKTHPFDESLTGLEDLAWGKGVQGAGYNISYSADAEVVHVHNETPRSVLNRYRKEGMAFKLIFPEAHFSLYDFVRNVLTNIGNDLLHALRLMESRHSLPGIFWFRFSQFWGTYHGYRHPGLLTPDLRQTFYYQVGWDKTTLVQLDVEPIRYYQQ
jgi:glycosyltransferase involved in cell wall biosynthesis